MHSPRFLLALPAALLGAALALPAAAGSLYQWTTPDGSVAFTDDPKRIPKSQREAARTIKTGNLSDYDRYTPARQGAATVDVGAEQTRRRAERLERLRRINAGEAREEPVQLRSGAQTVLRLDNRTSIAIPHDPSQGDEQEPVVVEEVRVRDERGSATQHVTVVRQGDRIVSIVKGGSTQSGADWGSLREALED